MSQIIVDASSDAPSAQIVDTFDACQRALLQVRPYDVSVRINFTQVPARKNVWEASVIICSDDFRQALRLKLLPMQAHRMALTIRRAISPMSSTLEQPTRDAPLQEGLFQLKMTYPNGNVTSPTHPRWEHP